MSRKPTQWPNKRVWQASGLLRKQPEDEPITSANARKSVALAYECHWPCLGLKTLNFLARHTHLNVLTLLDALSLLRN